VPVDRLQQKEKEVATIERLNARGKKREIEPIAGTASGSEGVSAPISGSHGLAGSHGERALGLGVEIGGWEVI